MFSVARLVPTTSALAAVIALSACSGIGFSRPGDIAEVAATTSGATTFMSAMTTAGLMPILHADGPYTVLVPSDEAFAALPPGTVERLMRPENRVELLGLLQYHVVPGRISTQDLPASGQAIAPSVQGDFVEFDRRFGLRVDNANIVSADITASNGVIHVIDRVILPE